MKQAFLRALCLAAALAAPAHAQNTSSLATGIASNDDNTHLTQQIVELKAQLGAIERETLRRLDCQANSQLSTPTGCQEVPGLRDYVAYMVAHPELQQ